MYINSELIEIGESTGIAPERTRYPARVVLLSGEPMYHSTLGDKVSKRFVIDLATAVHDPVINANYNHNDEEQVGNGENIRIENNRLVCDGTIVPFKPNDRAEEIIFRSKNGTRYQASIEFPELVPDIEEVPAGEIMNVNGQSIEGPIRIYRNVPIRAYAVCPNGNDSKTEFTILNLKKENTMPTKTNTAKLAAEKADAETKTSAHPDFDELIELFGEKLAITLYKDGVDIADARKVAEFNKKYGIVPEPEAPTETAELNAEKTADAEPAKTDEAKKEDTAALKAELAKLSAGNVKLTSEVAKLSARLEKTSESDGVSSGHSAEKQKKELSEKEKYFQSLEKFLKI